MIMNGRASAGAGGVNGGGCRFPFSASQWQELGEQALIFKHMASGVPVPPDLLFTIRRSLDSNKLFAHPAAAPHIGWNGFEMGLGRKIDQEPGRCRRTDGKKWRCSKEAFQDSKYCEKHMHRGKNRSRKPVEQLVVNKTNAITLTTNCSKSHQSSSVASDNHLSPPACAYYNISHPYHLHSSSSSNSRFDSTHIHLHSASYYRSRYDGSSNHGSVLKEVADEQSQSLLNEDSVKGLSSNSWHLMPLTIGMSHQMNDELQESSRCELMTPDDQQQTHKTVYTFLEERPPDKKDSSWLNHDDKSSDSCTAQLLISIPPATSHHVFPIFNSKS
uniref:Growth-regulating factor n=2 Tax=Kalanchoe fedtschenkoi TaxID=63787 RepID=A0A7N0V008_KALFE